jgi:hypothetical protein
MIRLSLATQVALIVIVIGAIFVGIYLSGYGDCCVIHLD